MSHTDQLLNQLQQKIFAVDTPDIVFDCDQTLLDGDIGEAFLAELLLQLEINPSDQWWALLGDDAISIRDLYRKQYSDPLVTTLSDACFIMLWNTYEALIQKDVYMAYIWAASCLEGWLVNDARSRCQQFVMDALDRPSQPTYWANDSHQIDIQRGVRRRDILFNWIKTLQSQHGQIWVISSSLQYLVDEICTPLALTSTSICGIEFLEDDMQRLTLNPKQPTPISHDKIQAFQSRSHRSVPRCMVGDSHHDLPLMKHADLGLLICSPHSTVLAEVNSKNILSLSPNLLSSEQR